MARMRVKTGLEMQAEYFASTIAAMSYSDLAALQADLHRTGESVRLLEYVGERMAQIRCGLANGFCGWQAFYRQPEAHDGRS